MSVCAVITAAGLSSRMGAFKPLLPIQGRPAVLYLLDTLYRAGVSHSVLVTGHNSEQLEDVCRYVPNLTVVHNPSYAVTQMFDSAKLGFSAVPGVCERVLFSPIDVPMVSENTVRLLIRDERPLVFPSYHYRRGHPAAIDCSLLSGIIQYSGEGGLRGAFASLPTEASYIVVDDPGCLIDMDTPDDYAAILNYGASAKGASQCNSL